MQHYRCLRLGIIFALLHAFFSSLSGVIINELPHIPAITINFYQHFLCLVVTCPLVLFRRYPLFPPNYRRVLVLRSLSSCVNVTLLFLSFRYIQFSDATAISFTSTAMTIVLAKLFLKEPCGVVHIVVITLSFSGVLLISRPAFLFHGLDKYDSDTMFGVSMALIATVLIATSSVTMRAMKTLQPATILVNFFFISVITLGFTTTLMNLWVLPHNLYQWTLVICLSIVALLSTTALTLAFRFESAGAVGTVTTSEIVFSYLWQYLFWNQSMHRESVVGALLIFTATLISSISRRFSSEDTSLPLPLHGNVFGKTIYKAPTYKDSVV